MQRLVIWYVSPRPRPGPSALGHGRSFRPSVLTRDTALISERMQDPSKGLGPYTSIYTEVHTDASPATSRFAQDADVEK